MPNVPIVLALTSDDTARTIRADWHRNLSELDVYEVSEGFDQMRWGTLVHDCWWLYEMWASRLVRDGWSAMDLFEVHPDQPGIGGLSDRLQGARNVLVDDERRSHWTRFGVRLSVCRGAVEALRGCDARLVWDFEGVATCG